MTKQPSAVNNLNKRTERLIGIIIITLVTSSLIVSILSYLSFQSQKTYQALRNEINSIKSSQTDTLELRNYVDDNLDRVALISSFFPNESNISVAYQHILDLVKEIDDDAQLSFNALIPSQYQNEASLPMKLELSANLHEVLSLLKQLERSPFIIEILSLDLSNPNSENSTAVILFRLYVNEQFIQP